MKRNRQYLITFLFSIILVAVFTGCSGQKDDESSSALSPAVSDYCSLIDEAVDEIEHNGTVEFSCALNSKLSTQFANDTTQLTDADREAINEHLEKLSRTLIKYRAKDNLTHEQIEQGTSAVLAQNKKAVEESRTLGQLITTLNYE